MFPQGTQAISEPAEGIPGSMSRIVCMCWHLLGISASELLPQTAQCKHTQASARGSACILLVLALMHIQEGAALQFSGGLELPECELYAAITSVPSCMSVDTAAHAHRYPHIAGSLR